MAVSGRGFFPLYTITGKEYRSGLFVEDLLEDHKEVLQIGYTPKKEVAAIIRQIKWIHDRAQKENFKIEPDWLIGLVADLNSHIVRETNIKQNLKKIRNKVKEKFLEVFEFKDFEDNKAKLLFEFQEMSYKYGCSDNISTMCLLNQLDYIKSQSKSYDFDLTLNFYDKFTAKLLECVANESKDNDIETPVNHQFKLQSYLLNTLKTCIEDKYPEQGTLINKFYDFVEVGIRPVLGTEHHELGDLMDLYRNEVSSRSRKLGTSF